MENMGKKICKYAEIVHVVFMIIIIALWLVSILFISNTKNSYIFGDKTIYVVLSITLVAALMLLANYIGYILLKGYGKIVDASEHVKESITVFEKQGVQNSLKLDHILKVLEQKKQD